MIARIAIVMLHGSGGNGPSLRDSLDYTPLSQVHNYRTFMEALNGNSYNHRFDLFTPTADLRPYTYHGGEHVRVWFDRSADFHDTGLDDREDLDGINESLSRLIQTLRDIEDQYEHIFVGGFSMGGGLVLHCLRAQLLPIKVRGVFTMGSFLVQRSLLLKEPLSSRAAQLPVLMMHGS